MRSPENKDRLTWKDFKWPAIAALVAVAISSNSQTPSAPEKLSTTPSIPQKTAVPENEQSANCFSLKDFRQKMDQPQDILNNPVCIILDSPAQIDSHLNAEKITYTDSGSLTVNVSVNSEGISVPFFTSSENLSKDPNLHFPQNMIIPAHSEIDAIVVLAKASGHDDINFPIAVIKKVTLP